MAVEILTYSLAVSPTSTTVTVDGLVDGKYFDNGKAEFTPFTGDPADLNFHGVDREKWSEIWTAITLLPNVNP